MYFCPLLIPHYFYLPFSPPFRAGQCHICIHEHLLHSRSIQAAQLLSHLPKDPWSSLFMCMTVTSIASQSPLSIAGPFPCQPISMRIWPSLLRAMTTSRHLSLAVAWHHLTRRPVWWRRRRSQSFLGQAGERRWTARPWTMFVKGWETLSSTATSSVSPSSAALWQVGIFTSLLWLSWVAVWVKGRTLQALSHHKLLWLLLSCLQIVKEIMFSKLNFRYINLLPLFH